MVGIGEVGDGSPEPTLRSDAADIVRGPSGTVKLFRCWVEFEGDACEDEEQGMSSSGGVWSAGGIGRPLAAATIWWSVHVSEKSSSPRQKGASFLSICRIGEIISVLYRMGPPGTAMCPGTFGDGQSYLELPDDGLCEVFGPNINTHGHQVSSIDMLFLETLLAVFYAVDPLTLQPPCFPLGLCLASLVGCLDSGGYGGPNAQEAANFIPAGAIPQSGAAVVTGGGGGGIEGWCYGGAVVTVGGGRVAGP